MGDLGTPLTLVAAPAVFGALGIEMPAPPQDPAPAATPARRNRENTKQAAMIAMLEEGATVQEVVLATGWQPHTARGAMAGGLKKRLGLNITSEKVGGRGRLYRIAR